MAGMTLAYGAPLTAALMAAAACVLLAVAERFGIAPTPAAQGITAPAAAHVTDSVVARKADDRVLPRGRRP